MKYDRLTEKYSSKTGDVYELQCDKCPMQHKCTDTDDCVNVASDSLGKLEDSIENGMLIPLNARVGDTVWVITSCDRVSRYTERETGYTECSLECDCYDENCGHCDPHTDIHLIKTKIQSIYLEANRCDTVYLLKDILQEYYGYAFGSTVFTNEEDALKEFTITKELMHLEGNNENTIRG